MRQYIGFHLRPGEYAVPITAVREIVNLPEITALPQSSPVLAGIADLRGTVIPVINVKRLLDIEDRANGEAKIVVITAGRLTFGILVDHITGVIGIDDNAIESPESMGQNRADQVEGVAKLNGKLIVLLNTRKLIPLDDLSLLDEATASTPGREAPGGDGLPPQVHDARRFFEQKAADCRDPRLSLFDDMMKFMEAIAARDYRSADETMQTLVRSSQGELFKEVGRVTRKLHDSVRGFRDAIDPRIRELAGSDMPNAVDRLRLVIEKTEEAVHTTMGIVEKHILRMDELASHVRRLEGPEESVAYLKKYKYDLEDDLTLIVTTQSFQDLTGQTLKKVIDLVNDVESELVKLIATFGVALEPGAPKPVPEKVSQADVDDLLREFGF